MMRAKVWGQNPLRESTASTATEERFGTGRKQESGWSILSEERRWWGCGRGGWGLNIFLLGVSFSLRARGNHHRVRRKNNPIYCFIVWNLLGLQRDRSTKRKQCKGVFPGKVTWAALHSGNTLDVLQCKGCQTPSWHKAMLIWIT
jgi:hypothetical protein